MASRAEKEDPVHAARHCLGSIPYRMVVFERMNGKTPLYRVAGSVKQALGAENALREAFAIHGGDCFYCEKKVSRGDLSIDHAEPVAKGGKPEIQNLLVSHPGCNKKKGHKAIETFNPQAGREWLSALLAQVQDRLNRLERATASAPHPPKRDATADP